MVQYKAAAVGVLVALFASLGEAFSPSFAKPTNPSNPASRKVELARAKVENMFGNEYTSMVDSMKMVSGGAQAEEYYEGEWSFLCITVTVTVVLCMQCSQQCIQYSIYVHGMTQSSYYGKMCVAKKSQ